MSGDGKQDDVEKKDEFLDDLLASCKTPPAPGEDFVQSSIDRRKTREANERLAARFGAAAEAANRLNRFVWKAAASGYKGRFTKEAPTGSGYLAGSLGCTFAVGAAALFFPPLTLTLIPAAFSAAAAGYFLHDKKPKAQLTRQCSRYTYKDHLPSLAGKLPDGPEKKMLLDFADAAKGHFLLGYAASLRARMQKEKGRGGGGRAAKEIGRLTSLVDEAAQAMKLPDAERVSLVSSLLGGSFPEARHFASKLNAQYNELDRAVGAKISALRRAP